MHAMRRQRKESRRAIKQFYIEKLEGVLPYACHEHAEIYTANLSLAVVFEQAYIQSDTLTSVRFHS